MKGYLLPSLDIVAPDSLLELYLEMLNVPLILDLHIALELLPNRRAICSDVTSNRTTKRYLTVGLIREAVRSRDSHNIEFLRSIRFPYSIVIDTASAPFENKQKKADVSGHLKGNQIRRLTFYRATRQCRFALYLVFRNSLTIAASV